MASDTTVKIVDIKVNLGEAVGRIAQFRAAIDEALETQKQLRKELKDGTITNEEYQRKMEESRQAINQNNEAILTLNRQIKQQQQIQNQQEGSLKQLRAQLSLLTQEYDTLGKAEREGARGDELRNSINEVTTQLKEAEEATQRFYRNVGNYEGAMKPLRTQLMELTQKLTEMKLAGQGNTEEFQELMKRASDLKDAMSDVSEQIGTGASDTGTFDSIKEGIEGVVSSYAAWKVISEGLGVKNQELDKIMATFAATLTIVNSLTAIQTSLQSQSALMKGVNAIKTWALNTALGAQATATTAVATAESGATAATIAWNAALYANPIVWLVGIVAAAVATIYGLIKAFEWFTADSEAQKQSLLRQMEAVDAISESYQRLNAILEAQGVSKTKLRAEEIKQLDEIRTLTQMHYNNAVILYEEDSDEFKKAQENKKKAAEDLQKSLDSSLIYLSGVISDYESKSQEKALGTYRYKKILLQKELQDQLQLLDVLLAQGEVSQMQYQMMVEKLNAAHKFNLENLEDEHNKEIQKKNEEARKKAEESARKAAESAKKVADDRKKYNEKVLQEMQKGEDALIELIKNSIDKQIKQEEVGYQRRIESLKKAISELKTNEINLRNAYNKQIEALEKQHQQKLATLRNEKAKEQINARIEVLQLELETVKKGSIEEYNAKKKTLAQNLILDLTDAKTRHDENKISEEQYQREVSLINEKYRQKRVLLDEEQDKESLDRQKAILKNRIDALTLNLEEEEDYSAKQRIRASKLELTEAEKNASTKAQAEQKRLQVIAETADASVELIKKSGQAENETAEEYSKRLSNAEKERDDAVKAYKEKVAIDEEVMYRQQIEKKLSILEGGRTEEVAIAYKTAKEELEAILSTGKRKEQTEEEYNQTVLVARENLYSASRAVEEEYNIQDETLTNERIEKKLNKLSEQDAEILRIQYEGAQASLNAIVERGMLENQTQAEFDAEVIAAKQEVQSVKEQINQKEVAMEQAKLQAEKSITDGLVNLLNAVGDKNSAAAKMAKIVTLAQIAIDTGRALSSGIASASSMPYPANLVAIATTVGTILANVATAISTVKSAKFAQGGKVTGPGTGTSDSISAQLSNGEYVVNAKSTSMFEPLLNVINGIGNGVPVLSTPTMDVVESNDSLANTITESIADIRPVVSVVEITEAQDRVNMIENLDNI